MKKRWAVEEDELLRKLYPTSTKEKLMNLLANRTWSSISCRANREGLKKAKLRITKKCLECNKSFDVHPCHNASKFCSRKCKGVWHSKNLLGDKASNWKGGNKTKNCLTCNKEIKVMPALFIRKKFCSKDCMHEYQRRYRKEVLCTWCKKKLKRSLSHIRYSNAFCSFECRFEHMKTTGQLFGELEDNPNWQDGKSFEPYGIEFNRKLKEQIRKRDNYTCQECGFTQKQLGYKLYVHHIDYNKQNNSSNNLISLCKQCHSQTNFNRTDWTTYFKNKMGDKH